MIAEVIDSNIERIRSDLETRGLTYDRLQEDILDHVCCLVEERMEHGEDFDTSYNQVLNHIGESTLGNLQHQTILLLDKKFQRMKNFTYLFGLSSALLAILGTLFKKMHWPGAGILLTVGIGLVILVFLPLYFIISYREQPEKKNPVYAIVGYLTLTLTLIAAIFKIQHWPGAGTLIEFSMVLILVGFVPLYLVNAFQRAGKKQIGLPYVVMLLIGISITLIAFNINVSKDLLDVYRAGTIDNNETVELVNEKSAALIERANDTAYDNVRETILEIQKEAASIHALIDEMQSGMKLYIQQPGVTVEELKEIDNKGAGREAILDSGTGQTFARTVNWYADWLVEMIDDPVVALQIKDHLDFAGDVWPYEYGVRDVEADPFMKTYYRLSDVAAGVALSEFASINYLLHQ
jgi:hypothetical protein